LACCCADVIGEKELLAADVEALVGVAGGA
jgi:hypothetical protein